MYRNIKVLVVGWVVLLVLLLPLPSFSDTRDNSDKEAVYTELFDATNAESQYEEMMNAMFFDFNESLTKDLYNSAHNVINLTKDNSFQAEQLIELVLHRTIIEYKLEVDRVFSFNEILHNVYIPLYAKYFSIEEIKEITAFYNSPTGKKYALKASSVMQETASMIVNNYSSKLNQLSEKIKENSLIELKLELEKLDKK